MHVYKGYCGLLEWKKVTKMTFGAHFWNSNPSSDNVQVHDLNWASIIKLDLAELL